MPQLYADLAKDSSIPSVHGGMLWGDQVNKRFYLFGGEYTPEQLPAADSTASLYAYDVVDNRWELMERPPSAISAVSYGAGVTVSERGEGYYYGGWVSNASNPGWTGPRAATTGLIKYDMDAKEVSTFKRIPLSHSSRSWHSRPGHLPTPLSCAVEVPTGSNRQHQKSRRRHGVSPHQRPWHAGVLRRDPVPRERFFHRTAHGHNPPLRHRQLEMVHPACFR